MFHTAKVGPAHRSSADVPRCEGGWLARAIARNDSGQPRHPAHNPSCAASPARSVSAFAKSSDDVHSVLRVRVPGLSPRQKAASRQTSSESLSNF
jgi:hypothetical protein